MALRPLSGTGESALHGFLLCHGLLSLQAFPAPRPLSSEVLQSKGQQQHRDGHSELPGCQERKDLLLLRQNLFFSIGVLSPPALAAACRELGSGLALALPLEVSSSPWC